MPTTPNQVVLTRAKEYFRAQLAKSLELAFLLPTDPKIDIDQEIAGAKLYETGLRKQLKDHSFSYSVQSDASELLNPHNPLANPKPSEAFKFACIAILRAKIENARIFAAHLGGEFHGTAPIDPWFAGIIATDLPDLSGEQPKSAPVGPTFVWVAQQFIGFKSKNDWAAKTSADVKRVVELASELIGPDRPMSLIDIDDVKLVRDALSALPPNYMKMTANKNITAKQAMAANKSGVSLSVKTQDKYFTMFRQLLIWGEAEGYLAKVPGAGIKVAGLKKIVPGEQRDPYSSDQLVKIVNSPLYRGHRSSTCRHKPGLLVVRDGYFWVPLIALYSGLRLGEILQLLKADLKEENGIYYFDVNKGDGKSLKTASSKRRVPVHHALVELGFVAYVQTKSSGRVFAEIKQGADGYHSHHFSKWWGRYASKVGFKADRTAFHSFRHNFLDGLRAANSPEYVNKALMGHSDQSVHNAYGSSLPLTSLQEAIEKIVYPIDLTALNSA